MKQLRYVRVYEKYLTSLTGPRWSNLLQKKGLKAGQNACERVMDALWSSKSEHFQSMATMLMLEVPEQKLKEITRQFVGKALEVLMKEHAGELDKFKKWADITSKFAASLDEGDEAAEVPEVPEAASTPPKKPRLVGDTLVLKTGSNSVDDEFNDEECLKTLQSPFNFSPWAPEVPVSEVPETSEVPEKVPETPEVPEVPETPEVPEVSDFKYVTDATFQPQPHWEVSVRGKSGFKHVTMDPTKAKPWRVKVGRRTVARYFTKAEACEGAYQFGQTGAVWVSPHEFRLGCDPE